MAKIKRYDGAYLRVDVGRPYLGDDPAHWHRVANDVAEQIKRHCDDVEQVTVEDETAAVCEFCGAPWSEDDGTYNGGCCSKDADASGES